MGPLLSDSGFIFFVFLDEVRTRFEGINEGEKKFEEKWTLSLVISVQEQHLMSHLSCSGEQGVDHKQEFRTSGDWSKVTA